MLEFRIDVGDQTDFAGLVRHSYDRRAFLERNLHNILPNGKELRVTVGSLSVGDYALLEYPNQDGTGEPAVRWLIERKGGDGYMSDMVASINDGRYQSQTSRMLLSGVRRLFWVIAAHGWPEDPFAEKRVRSAIAHMEHMDRIKVVRVEDSNEAFLEWVKKMLIYESEEMERGDGPCFQDMPLYKFVQLKGKKEELDNQPVVWREQIRLIKQIGANSALAIVEHYPSWLDLAKAYARCAKNFDRVQAAKAGVGLGAGLGPTKGKKRTVKGTNELEALDDMLAVHVKYGGGSKKKGLGKSDSKRVRQVLFPDEQIESLQELFSKVE